METRFIIFLRYADGTINTYRGGDFRKVKFAFEIYTMDPECLAASVTDTENNYEAVLEYSKPR